MYNYIPLFLPFLKKDGMSKSDVELLLSDDVGIEFTFLSQAFDTRFSTPMLVNGTSVSNPVAITVITISSPAEDRTRQLIKNNFHYFQLSLILYYH